MRKTTVIKKCEGCGSEMSMPLWLSKRKRFCSKLCNGARVRKETENKYHSNCLQCSKVYKKGHANPGNFCSRGCYWQSLVGLTPWNKGMRGFRAGVAHHNWKGGVTPENHKIRQSVEYRLWREAVFARDNWTCKDCKEKGGKLHAHHIKQFALFPELRFAIDNGLTLCKKCHLKIKHENVGKLSANLTNL